MSLLTVLITAIVLAWATPRQAAPPTARPVAAPQASAVTRGSVKLPVPFAAARIAPGDVRVFVHVEQAGRLRRDLATRPIARTFTSLAGGNAAAQSWSALARSLKMDEATLFDHCFGREITFIARDAGEWALVTDLGPERARDLMRTLAVRVREPRFGLAVSELPEQALLLASDGGQVVIGPSGQPQLFLDVLERWSAGERPAAERAPATLAGNDDFTARLREIQCEATRADIAAFIRHDRPLGGCSMFVADVRGEDVAIKHAARFDNPPFNSPVTNLACDFSPLNLLADHALVAVMQPRDVGDGPVENYLSAGLGVGLLSAEMRRNLADRRLLVMGEADARQLPQPRNILTTTFVAALEVKDVQVAAGQLDQQMSNVTQRINELGQGAFLIQMPDCGALRAHDPRQADLGAAGEWFAGGFPVMKTVSLNWAIAEGPPREDGSGATAWFVVGSHPQALQETIASLRKPCPRDERLVGKYDSCGTANGRRLGRQVQSWSDEAPEFTDPKHVDRVRSTLQALADLASGLSDCHWQMARPTANSLRLDVQLKLAPAETVK